MFIITQRQYDIIMKQAQVNYPNECGGFLGGRDGVILGILPIPNLHLGDRTKSFGLLGEDIERALLFFEKHNLEYYGIYHSHPRGIPYPSHEDLSHGNKFLFIIGLRDRYSPELYAYEIDRQIVMPQAIRIVDESMVEKMILSPVKHKLSEVARPDEMTELNNMINNMIAGKKTEYPVEPPPWDSSSFSTRA